MDSFDADVLIYAGRGDPRGEAVLALFDRAEEVIGVGSTLLIPELLVKPIRVHDNEEREALVSLLGRLELIATDRRIADLAVTVGVKYGLKALDAVHLATAISTGADRFITNNRRDFDAVAIDEIDVVRPDQLVW